MKVTKIKSLCKAEHKCMIYEMGRYRLIGTTNAAYPAENLAITTEGIATLFDWPDVKEDIVVDAMMFPESQLYPNTQYCSKEHELSVGFSINYYGEEIVPLCCQEGVFFIRGVYRDAAEKKEGYDRYHLARNVEGEPLVMLSDGLMAPAVIKPLPRKTAAEICNYLCRIGEMPAQGWTREEGKTEDAQLKGQINMDEVLEEKKENDGE